MARPGTPDISLGIKAVCDRMADGFSEEVDGLIDHPAEKANVVGRSA
jgi:hypothetical protein